MKDLFLPLISALATAVGGTLVAWFLARVRSGRFARTLDQAGKVVEFFERWTAAHEKLAKIPDNKREAAEALLDSTLAAVRDDLAAEQSILSEFGTTTSKTRKALLLYLPDRGMLWIPTLLFFTLVAFVFYIIALRLIQGQWSMEDNIAVVIAVGCAVLVRLVIALLPSRA